MRPSSLPILTSILLFLTPPTSANNHHPVTWTKYGHFNARAATSPFFAKPRDSSDAILSPGDINCRYDTDTVDEVNYNTCTELCEKYDITPDLFFILNPDLKTDCSNIMPQTTYCVAGFIEPVRALDGLCGPKHNNATCLGMDFQCCNAETFKCGESEQDCAPGTCYEGACAGDKRYGTDGTCGPKYGNRLCAGKWGDCCDLSGACGTGTAFCGIGSCQSGNCTNATSTSSSATLPSSTSSSAALPLQTDNTADNSASPVPTQSSILPETSTSASLTISRSSALIVGFVRGTSSIGIFPYGLLVWFGI